MTTLIEVTEDEARMIVYALNELGNRRLEQSMNARGDRGLANEAERHYALARRFKWDATLQP